MYIGIFIHFFFSLIPCIDLFSPIQALEPIVHGRGRKSSSLDETYFGVYEELLYARKVEPVKGKFFSDSLQFFCPSYIGFFLMV